LQSLRSSSAYYKKIKEVKIDKRSANKKNENLGWKEEKSMEDKKEDAIEDDIGNDPTRDIKEIINDYQKKLGVEIKKNDANNENTDNLRRINNLSIDIESKLADVNKKILDTFSNSANELFEKFKNLINENSFSTDLNEFGSYISEEIDAKNKEIDIKNEEIDIKNKEIEEERERLLVEKMELLSSLLVWKNKKETEFKQ
jgi:hypothetical protein